MAERFFLCIDLKSFFASVEAVDRGLDPFNQRLYRLANGFWIFIHCGYLIGKTLSVVLDG